MFFGRIKPGKGQLMIQELIHETVKIHPSAVIGPGVTIGANSEIFPHTYLEYCEIGENCKVSPGAVIGTAPQDLSYKGEETKVVIGNNCQIREHVTINRASGEGNITEVGNECFLMTGAHIAHNCKVGNNVIIANNSLLAGHVLIEDYVFVGGAVAMHQFCRVGEMAMVGGCTAVRNDIIPYSKVNGIPCKIIGLNTIGLKRRGLSQEERTLIKKAVNLIWFAALNTQQALGRIKEELPSNQYIDHLVEFVNTSKRGIAKSSRKDEDDE